jgi:hypothetical protein
LMAVMRFLRTAVIYTCASQGKESLSAAAGASKPGEINGPINAGCFCF